MTAKLPTTKLPIVGVMGSGRDAHEELAAPLGRLVAELGAHLLTGGGGGVMTSTSRAFAETPGRRGLVLAVLPSLAERPGEAPPGYPNPWVEVAVRTHLPWSGERGEDPLSRNHLNVLTADAVVVLPGSAGTQSEARLALAYGRPAIAFLPSGGAPGLPEGLEAVSELTSVRAFLERVL